MRQEALLRSAVESVSKVIIGHQAPCLRAGVRNPWRISVDSATGNLWVADVGQDKFEEVDVVSPAARNVNFGWSCKEANSGYNADQCETWRGTSRRWQRCAMRERRQGVPPFVGESIIGGYVYRGSLNPALRGTYVFADFISGKIFGYRSGELKKLASLGYITSFGESDSGELFAVTYSGSLYRLIAAWRMLRRWCGGGRLRARADRLGRACHVYTRSWVMPSVTVALADGVGVREVPDGSSATDLFTDREVVVARINGELRDLSTLLSEGDTVEPVLVDSEDGRAVPATLDRTCVGTGCPRPVPGDEVRHRTTGQDGFYYDFDPAEPFTPRILTPSPNGCSRSSRKGSSSRVGLSLKAKLGPSLRTSRTSANSSVLRVGLKTMT